jgi:tungstate transport system substrate-binding protein
LIVCPDSKWNLSLLKRKLNKLLPALLVLGSTLCFGTDEELKVAVIGGLDMSGVWSRIEESAEKSLKLEITTVIAAPKEQVVPAFMNGEADLLLIHGGDETFALEALGYASALRTWGYNEFVFVGPEDDPAGVSQAASGREAIQKLQMSGQPLITFRDPGSYQVLKRLMDQANLVPAQLQLLPDTVNRPQQILVQAARDLAYVVVGHLPVAFGRMPSEGTRILLSGDPSIRRAYVVVTPGPQHSATPAARVNAEKLAEYLLSEDGQRVLSETGPTAGVPWIFPRVNASGLLQFQVPQRTRSGTRGQ